MKKIEELEYRLKYIAGMIEENFFEYDKSDDNYFIPDKYKDYKSIIQEVFYVSAMGEITLPNDNESIILDSAYNFVLEEDEHDETYKDYI